MELVVLQVAGHGQAQLVAVLQQKLLLLLLCHLILHELIACIAQACMTTEKIFVECLNEHRQKENAGKWSVESRHLQPGCVEEASEML